MRVQCRRKESSRSLSHLLMSFLLVITVVCQLLVVCSHLFSPQKLTTFFFFFGHHCRFHSGVTRGGPSPLVTPLQKVGPSFLRKAWCRSLCKFASFLTITQWRHWHPERQLRVPPLYCFPEKPGDFFCSSQSLSLSLFIAFTRVLPPPGCHPTPFYLSDRPRFSTILCKLTHNIFSSPGGCHPGLSTPSSRTSPVTPLPSLVIRFTARPHCPQS